MLAVGVGADELHAFDTGLHHLIDGVATTTTDTDDPNNCLLGLTALNDLKDLWHDALLFPVETGCSKN